MWKTIVFQVYISPNINSNDGYSIQGRTGITWITVKDEQKSNFCWKPKAYDQINLIEVNIYKTEIFEIKQGGTEFSSSSASNIIQDYFVHVGNLQLCKGKYKLV